jgi:hypothetical protein
MTAHWFSQLDQPDLLEQYNVESDQTTLEEREDALRPALEYNNDLNAGGSV